LLISSAINVKITNDTKTLDTIEITDCLIKRNPIVSDKILRSQWLSVSVSNVGDYLRGVLNVSGIRKGGGVIDPIVRGFKFSQLNAVMNGGIKIENGFPNRSDLVSSPAEAEDIDKINVIKGPFFLNSDLL